MEEKKEFQIKGRKWIFYILGWFGLLNVVFWMYQCAGYLEDGFTWKNFHQRVYRFGFFVCTIILISSVTLIAIAFF